MCEKSPEMMRVKIACVHVQLRQQAARWVCVQAISEFYGDRANSNVNMDMDVIKHRPTHLSAKAVC